MLSSSAQEAFTQLSKSKKTKKLDVVRLPEALYNETTLTFEVDTRTESLMFGKGSGTEVTVVRNDLQVLSDDEIAWSGTIMYGLNEEVGDVTLIQNREGAVTGTIDLEGTFYEIRPLGTSNMHAVRQVDTRYMKDLYRENDVVNGKNKGVGFNQMNVLPDDQLGSSATTQASARCSPEYHRILVLYTANAAQGRDIGGITSLAIQEANESYGNSQVNNMRIALAHSQQINFNEGNDIEEDLIDLTNNIAAQNIRNQYDADAVVLLTDGNYTIANFRILGIADEILADANSAYAIVEAEHAAGPDYTFPHELGHLQGAQHHPDDATEPGRGFSYGFGHRFSYKGSIFVPRRYRSTIMANPCRPDDLFCERVYSRRKHFSNPNVEYNGADTGIPGERENYRALRTTAAYLADFRDAYELRTSVSSVPDGNTTQYRFTANPCGGVGNYSYEWRISYYDPYSFGGIVSTAQSFTRTFPEGQHYVRATVRSTINQEARATAVVYVSGDCFGFDCPVLQSKAPEMVSGGALEQIPGMLQLHPAYPNPFNPATRISFSLPQAQTVKLTVYDMAGREVAVLADGPKAAGTHRFRFGEQGLSSGIYFVRLQAGNVLQTQKITLLK